MFLFFKQEFVLKLLSLIVAPGHMELQCNRSSVVPWTVQLDRGYTVVFLFMMESGNVCVHCILTASSTREADISVPAACW